MDAELESNSDFTMSTEQDKLCLISKDALKSRMEVIKPGVTAPEANPKCTNGVLFQEVMGNAVLSLSVRHQTCGFACLVDTTPQFKQRLPKDQMHIEPADVPSPPIAPTREERGDKSVMNLYKCNLNKCRKAVHIKTIRFNLFSEVFPDCSASKKGPLGFPPDFHLKNSLAHVLNNTISRMEQDEEFLGLMVDLLNLHCRHESKTNGIDKHFKAIKKLKRKQDLAVLHPGVGSDHLQLINHTQTQTFEGVGGRKDPVHELKTKWSLK